MNFRPLHHGTPEHSATLALRDEVLRQPLGMKLSAHDTAGEESQQHFGAFNGERLVACVVAHVISDSAQFRQMAVAESERGRGVGKRLLVFAEESLAEQGVQKFWLNARLSVLPFYVACGYVAVGEPFTEVTIPHQRMEKLPQRRYSAAGDEN